MIIIDVHSKGGIEKALKALKRKFNDTGVLKELRNRKTYTKKSIKRRETLLKARYTHQKSQEQNVD